jgi:dipeptidyl aminopeptidase/acylaminoacyl peptidase
MSPVATVGLALIVAYLIGCAWLYHRLTRIPRDSWMFTSSNTPAAFDAPPVETGPYLVPHFESVSFMDRTTKVRIAGWWMPVDDDPGAPAVIAVHGYTACRRDGSVLLAAGMLHRHGIAALAIDLRNHGESGRTGGRHTGGVREADDVLGAWDWLVKFRGLAPERIGLFGISLGAASVLIAAGDEPRVAAVWSDSSYGDLDEATRAEVERSHLPALLLPGGQVAARLLDGPGLRGKSPLLAMGRMGRRAVYITHGRLDTRLEVHFADQLIAAGLAAGSTGGSWIVDDAEHAGAIVDHPAEYEHRLTDFFGRSLVAAEPATPTTGAAAPPEP